MTDPIVSVFLVLKLEAEKFLTEPENPDESFHSVSTADAAAHTEVEDEVTRLYTLLKKGDRRKPNYMPVSLVCIPCKLMEKIGLNSLA